MVKIKSEDLKIIIPIAAVFSIILAVTIIYPRYNDIWSLLFWIGILYMSFRTISDSNAQSKSLNEIHISVKVTFALAIIIGLLEVFFGDGLIISIALMVLAIVFDIIFSRKKE